VIFPLPRTASAMLAILLLTTTAAHAVDLRSWDQKISQPQKRFVVLSAYGNQAVLDKETQLVWQRSPSDAPFDWVGANYHCGSLAIGGRYGWRLPSAVELMSLFDADSVGSDQLPAGHPFQGNFVAYFWSSTFYPASTTHALWVNPANVSYEAFLATSSGPNAWCVRGPGAAN
jgi:hypothetical protein